MYIKQTYNQVCFFYKYLLKDAWRSNKIEEYLKSINSPLLVPEKVHFMQTKEKALLTDVDYYKKKLLNLRKN